MQSTFHNIEFTLLIYTFCRHFVKLNQFIKMGKLGSSSIWWEIQPELRMSRMALYQYTNAIQIYLYKIWNWQAERIFYRLLLFLLLIFHRLRLTASTNFHRATERIENKSKTIKIYCLVYN